MAAEASGWKSATALMVLGAILVLALFLILRPLRVSSPASSGARAMLRLDGALGATVEPVDRVMALNDGLPEGSDFLVVTSVANKGPAASAGLRVGDVIEAIDGKPAERMSDITEAEAPVTVWRNGKENTVNVQFEVSRRG